jgi:hypothetical protein
MPRILHHDDRSIFQGKLGSFENGTEPLKHEGGSLVLKTKQNDARPFSRGRSGDLAKVEVECYYDSVFRLRFREDIRVGHPL